LLVDKTERAGRPQWDAYAVWQILLHRHPVRIEDPAGSCGRIDPHMLPEIFEVIADYPAYLQDAVLVLAHAEGIEAAMEALDQAVREVLCDPKAASPSR
jgi:hypothetical protein